MAAIALLAASCQNGGGSSAGLSENSTQADSLMYYLGQWRGGEYKKTAQNDTTLLTPDSENGFLQGVKAGLNAIKADDEVYNKGLMQGISMAMNMVQFAQDYGITLDKQVFIESLTAAIKSDSVIDVSKMQREFRQVLNKVDSEKNEKDQKESQENLAQAVKQMNLPKISDDLYGKITKTTNGDSITPGDMVQLECKIYQLDGKEINAPLPPTARVGTPGIPPVINQALRDMKSGETGEFITTSKAIFAKRGSQFDLKPTDVLKIVITAELKPEDKNPGSPNQD